MGFAKTDPEGVRHAVPQDSALLKCEECGNSQRVWLSRCKLCSAPEDNWYEKRIAFLEKLVKDQDKLIRAQSDKLNAYSAKVKKLQGSIENVCELIASIINDDGYDRLNGNLIAVVIMRIHKELSKLVDEG